MSNRIFYLISKCLIKKLTNFDALPEANYTHQLKDLYLASFDLADSNLSKICQKSIRLFHALTLSPFESLCISRNNQQNDDRKNFAHLEVLAQKCKTAWELHNVKKAFQYAKLLLSSDNLKSNQSFDEFDNGMENFENEDDSLASTNDDKNFFRDFSLKFGTNSSMNTKDEYFIYEVIKCLTSTYLVSIKLEQNLPLKILLSKIFYLNYEHCLATFVILTRKKLNFESKIEKFNYDSLSEFSNIDQLKILINKDPKKNFFAQYFSTYINQVNSYYQFLFETCHQIKLVGGVFENFLDKFENKDLSDYSEEMLSKEIEMFMEDFKKKNKIDLETTDINRDGDGEKIYSDRDNRNLFRIWSQEIVPYLFLNLNNSKKFLIKNLAELILNDFDSEILGFLKIKKHINLNSTTVFTIFKTEAIFLNIKSAKITPNQTKLEMSRRNNIPSRSYHQYTESNHNLKIVKTEVQENGEAFQLVRPTEPEKKNSQEIVSKLIQQYGSKPIRNHKSEELNTVQAAFPKVAKKLLTSYEGSNIVSDSQQDLIGDRYLAEQIRQINQENRKKSILDKWSHLLYEGEDERSYVSSYQPPVVDYSNLQPIRSTTFTLNNAMRPGY
ncbi:hypothetical protein BpHYR1_022535 [Brachionus plicatilis]|uniref:Uncharacterized protein n=1 Tax=Brachionus plicatilis TaxID=10195 RepID=A0A3M7QLN1_BRAPC|nr:hypothetical protein BpHYR1_022535 [Brachionus plicatilis]